MNSIGSWWVVKQQAIANERNLMSFAANRRSSAYRAIGGELHLTNKRMLFLPNYIDFLLGGKRLVIYNHDISEVGRQIRGGNLFSGGLRDRLRVEHSGGCELFVVSNLDVVVDIITSEIDGVRHD